MIVKAACIYVTGLQEEQQAVQLAQHDDNARFFFPDELGR